MGKIAFLFAGQGAQKAGMGRSIYEASTAARKAMDEAESIRPGTLAQCFEGPDEALRQTVNTQPCLMLVDYACALAAREAGVAPDCAAGFSLGEVAAAAFAGMLPFEAAFRLVIRRAELMQAAATRHPGAMGAVLRLSAGQVEAVCAQVGEAYPVNYNCPGQIVVACLEDRFDALAAAVTAQRGRVVRLNVSGAFHSPWMREAEAGLAEYLAGVDLKAPDIPLYANATGRPYAGDLKALLSRQVASPVRFEDSVRAMAEAGVTTFIEVGPGTTLGGLTRRTLTARVFNVEDEQSLRACMEGLNA